MKVGMYIRTKKTREKMRKAKLGKASNWKGHTPTKETRLKMRLAKLGKRQKKEHIEKNRQGQFRRHSKNNPNYIPYTWADLRQMRMALQEGKHTLGEWDNLKAQYNWTCALCKKKEPQISLTRDHIIPISKGGSDNIENIQPLCRSCNSTKHTLTIKY